MITLPENMDKECVRLCNAMNARPGIETFESCCGHSKEEYHIWYIVTDYNKRGLLALSRFLSFNYHAFGLPSNENPQSYWKIILDHMDISPQICFRLEGPIGDFEGADELAKLIEDHVADVIPYYNILLDK